MWPFNRQTVDNTGMPAETHQSYQSVRTERMSIAWILAFVTLIVTLLIVVGLFMGGRAVYRVVAKHNTKGTYVVNGDTKPAATVTPSTSTTTNNSGHVSTQAAVTKTPSTTAAPVTAPTPLPRTGPIGDD